jgi:hypothetical protein
MKVKNEKKHHVGEVKKRNSKEKPKPWWKKKGAAKKPYR